MVFGNRFEGFNLRVKLLRDAVQASLEQLCVVEECLLDLRVQVLSTGRETRIVIRIGSIQLLRLSDSQELEILRAVI